MLRFAGGHPEGGPGTSAGSQVRAGDVAGRPTTAVSSAGWTTSGRLRSARPRWSRENHSEQRSGAVRPHGPTSAVPGSARGPSGGHPGVGTRTRHQVRRTCLPATVCASAVPLPLQPSPCRPLQVEWDSTLLATARGGRGAAATQGPQTASGHPERGTKAPLQGQPVPWLDGCPPWCQATRVPASSTTAAGWAGEEPA